MPTRCCESRGQCHPWTGRHKSSCHIPIARWGFANWRNLTNISISVNPSQDCSSWSNQSRYPAIQAFRMFINQSCQNFVKIPFWAVTQAGAQQETTLKRSPHFWILSILWIRCWEVKLIPFESEPKLQIGKKELLICCGMSHKVQQDHCSERVLKTGLMQRSQDRRNP